MAEPAQPLLLVTLGHLDRGDDAAASRVLDALRPDLPPSLTLLERPSDPATIVLALHAARRTVVVDTLRSPEMACGEIVRLEGDTLFVRPDRSSTASHGNALAASLALARRLGPWPLNLRVHGVVGRRFALGDRLSPEIRQALPCLVARVRADLAVFA